MSHDASGFLATEINPMSKILILLVMNFLIFFTRNPVLISFYFVISISMLLGSGVSPKSMKARPRRDQRIRSNGDEHANNGSANFAEFK
jgi:hypothetical protein